MLNIKLLLPLALISCVTGCNGVSSDKSDSQSSSQTSVSMPTTMTETEIVSEPDYLSQIQKDVFTPNCASSGCHTGSYAQMGVRLDSISHSFNTLVGVQALEKPDLLRVAPNEPDASYLIKKLEGGADIVGMRMPMSTGPLSDEKIQLVRDWITQGAHNSSAKESMQVSRSSSMN